MQSLQSILLPPMKMDPACKVDESLLANCKPHHRQAVDMANLAADRAESDQVKQLATAIQQAQGPEIQQLQGFLAAWGFVWRIYGAVKVD